MSGVKDFIDSTNAGYEQVHRKFEEQFWGTKMALSNGTPLADGKGPAEYSVDELTKTKMDMEAFLADSAKLDMTRQFLAKPGKLLCPLECICVQRGACVHVSSAHGFLQFGFDPAPWNSLNPKPGLS